MNLKAKSLISCAATTFAILFGGCTPAEPEAPAPAKEAVEPQPADAATPQATAAPESNETTQAAATNDNPTAEGPQLVAPTNKPMESISQPTPPTNEPQESIAHLEEAGPQSRTAFYRVDANAPAAVPPVVLSKEHEALCRVKVGDTMPAIELPQIGSNDEGNKLSDLFGEKATAVVFWKSDRRMALEELADLGPDVIEQFGPQGVTVVGVAVDESAASVEDALAKAGAKFTNLLDADGEAFALVGSEKLPRTYLLDPHGKILWFDIEYSHATRRELHRALRAIVGDAGEKQE